MNLFGWLKRSKLKREIIVNVEKLETRVAVLENGRLEEFMVEHPEAERLVGSVFKGRVQNLENDLQAAFVDIGLKKNAFLHYWDSRRRPKRAAGSRTASPTRRSRSAFRREARSSSRSRRGRSRRRGRASPRTSRSRGATSS